MNAGLAGSFTDQSGCTPAPLPGPISAHSVPSKTTNSCSGTCVPATPDQPPCNTPAALITHTSPAAGLSGGAAVGAITPLKTSALPSDVLSVPSLPTDRPLPTLIPPKLVRVAFGKL